MIHTTTTVEVSAPAPEDSGVADDGGFTAQSPPELNKSLRSDLLSSTSAVPVQPTEAGGAVAAPSEVTVEKAETERFCEAFFDACKLTVDAMATSEAETARHLYDFLAHVAKVEESPQFDLKVFCDLVNLPHTNATKAYPAIIRGSWLKAGRKIDGKVASNQGLALKFAMEKCGDPACVAEYLRDNGGIQQCLKKSRAGKKRGGAEEADPARPDPDERRISEDVEVTGTTTVTVSGVPYGFTGMCTVRIDGTGQGEFVVRARPSPVPDAPPDEPETDRQHNPDNAAPGAGDGLAPPAEPPAAEEVPAAAQG